MHQEENCIFCKIIKKEIPCDLIYENNKFFVFLDINPVSHGHILIIPKKHIVWMQEADDKTISDIFKLTKKIMLAMKKGMMCDYVQISVNGEEVPHFHIHVIPRYFDDNLPQFPRKKYQEGEPSELVKRLTQAL
ncbi:MAG TPA: HIT domain-containing protein [Candidatus Paceibacterota bacterium]|nr:HIT domain-containing protein [Candidatus Paceibacterota bacterium]